MRATYIYGAGDIRVINVPVPAHPVRRLRHRLPRSYQGQRQPPDLGHRHR